MQRHLCVTLVAASGFLAITVLNERMSGQWILSKFLLALFQTSGIPVCCSPSGWQQSWG